MAKTEKGFFEQSTVEIKHEGKTYRVFAGEAEQVKKGLAKISKKAEKPKDK